MLIAEIERLALFDECNYGGTKMKKRNCPVCKKEIDCDSPICQYCHKGVFIIDFGDDAAKFFDKPLLQAYEVCRWQDKTPNPDGHIPKPPREWVCTKYEPVVFVDR